MKITKLFLDTFVQTAQEQHADAKKLYQQAVSELRDAEQLIAYANTLKVGDEFRPFQVSTYGGYASNIPAKRRLYHLPSRTGRPDGHFIEHMPDGSWICSCPGGQNRGYCWAIEKLVVAPSYELARHQYMWSDHDFDFRAKYQGEGDKKANVPHTKYQNKAR